MKLGLRLCLLGIVLVGGAAWAAERASTTGQTSGSNRKPLGRGRHALLWKVVARPRNDLFVLKNGQRDWVLKTSGASQRARTPEKEPKAELP